MHIVLVEPEIPGNTGNIARLCAATGCALHLVEPLGFSIDDRSLKRAGLDYWHAMQVVVHACLPEFLAATAQRRHWFLSTHASRLYTAAAFTRGDMLVFGAETRGLPRALLAERADAALRIPMREQAVRSLNLATAAGIVTYTALACLGFPELG
ncbi:MAG: tRNA (cytidine(34)-2'-O)-methyltransferase [Vulcanimicrobiaceae bacterium]